MKTLSLERFKQASQSRVEAGGFTFTLQRPTLAEVYSSPDGRFGLEFVARHIVGWEGVKESDLIPGGDPEPVAFEPLLVGAWLADRLDLLAPLGEALAASFKTYEEAQDARGKP